MRAYLTVAEAAEVLGVSRCAVFHRISRGQVPVVRLGRSVRVEAKSLVRTFRAGGERGGSPVRVQGRRPITTGVQDACGAAGAVGS